jgi:preprotein translocase subunit SecF
MDEQLYKKIEDMEIKINEIYKVMNTAKNMMKWSIIITAVLFIIPLIILAFILPSMLDTITSSYSGLL